MPLIECRPIIADIDQASARFLSSSDENLRNWLNNYPEDNEAMYILQKLARK